MAFKVTVTDQTKVKSEGADKQLVNGACDGGNPRAIIRPNPTR